MRIILIIISIIGFNLHISAQQEDLECNFEVGKKASKLYKKASKELEIRNYSSATSLLLEALEESPDYLQALWTLANINNKNSNRYRKEEIAIESYTQIIELCPSYKNYYAYYRLGKIYFDKEEWLKSHELLEAFVNAETDKVHSRHYEDALDLSKYAKFYAELINNPVPFEPVLVNDVSSLEDEFLPSLSPDNEYLYFTRRGKKKNISRFENSESAKEERFCVAQITESKRYNVGNPMDYPFNEQSNEGGATLTINNKELFYTRCVLRQDRTLNCDICYSKYEDGTWSDIQKLGAEINTPQYWESMPSISSDGNTLYFVSDRKGGYGGYDIYKSVRDENGKWSKAINMGPGINTAGNEKSPFIHTDSQTLYFSSADRKDENTEEWFAGHMGLGGYDIFYTRLDSNSAWISPKNIGYPINSENNDLGFFVSTDGKHGFFASNKLGVITETQKNSNVKPKTPWNIYSFELYQEARPQKVLFIKGNLKDEDSEGAIREATIEIKNVKTREINEIPIDEETGEFVVAMVMKSDYTMTVKKKDYTYITRYIGKEDTRFNSPMKIDMEMRPVEIGKSYNLEDIYFASDSEYLTEASKKVVEGFYDFLHDNPNVRIEIQGHTDNVGADNYNMTLSQARAKTVYDLLIKLGIPEKQMQYKGYGETEPIADNDTEEGRAMNRRTVFLILSK